MTKENPSIVAFKAWIFPSLVSLVSLMIWNDVNEIKADVKALMAQSAVDKTRIDNLERVVFGEKTGSANIPRDKRLPEPPYNTIAIMPSRDEFAVVKVKKKNI